MSAKMDFSTLYQEMVAKVVIVIRLEVLTHHVNGLLDNVIVNQVLLGMFVACSVFIKPTTSNFILEITDSIVTNVNRISMAFHRLAVNRVIVTAAVRKDSNAIRMVNVLAMTMSKDDVATDAKRTNTIDIKDVWTVRIATI